MPIEVPFFEKSPSFLYYREGRPIRESSGTSDKTAAKKLMRNRETDIDRGLPVTAKVGAAAVPRGERGPAERVQGQQPPFARRAQAPDHKTPDAVFWWAPDVHDYFGRIPSVQSPGSMVSASSSAPCDVIAARTTSNVA